MNKVQYEIHNIRPINQKYAEQIAYNWKYKGKYAFYNETNNEEELQTFLDDKLRKPIYYAVLNREEELIGFYSYTFENDVMWFGLGLHPKLIGKGHGKDFMQTGINFGIDEFEYHESKILLTVAEFNKRAIHLYESLGFIFIEEKNIIVNKKTYRHEVMGKRLNNKLF